MGEREAADGSTIGGGNHGAWPARPTAAAWVKARSAIDRVALASEIFLRANFPEKQEYHQHHIKARKTGVDT